MKASEVSQLFKVLATAIRVQIILMMAESPMSYSSIQARLSGITTGTLNFRLTKLVPWRRLRFTFLITYGLFALYVVFLQLVSPVEQGIATSLIMTIVTLMVNMYKD